LITVVFACIHNAGRSQMASALFERIADPKKARALSAGTKPADRVHPEVVAALQELGIDVADAKPRRLAPELARGAALLVTMGCGEECPVVPGAEHQDWPIDDPKNLPMERVREIRDEIAARIEELVRARSWGRGA
jgi:arsenate reductase (thioredoxin)